MFRFCRSERDVECRQGLIHHAWQMAWPCGAGFQILFADSSASWMSTYVPSSLLACCCCSNWWKTNCRWLYLTPCMSSCDDCVLCFCWRSPMKSAAPASMTSSSWDMEYGMTVTLLPATYSVRNVGQWTFPAAEGWQVYQCCQTAVVNNILLVG